MTDADLLDDLTGLFRPWSPYPGWRFVPERAAPWLARPPSDTVFLALGLRGFKPVNDAHGAMVGDRLLAEAGRRIREVSGDWPAFRVAGDEFLVALRLPDEDAIRTFAARIRARLEQPHEGISVRTWAAAGRAAPGDTPDLLFRRTDRAMVAVTQNRWSGLVIAPPEADGTTWYEPPPEG